jgi:hypothetical protein
MPQEHDLDMDASREVQVAVQHVLARILSGECTPQQASDLQLH